MDPNNPGTTMQTRSFPRVSGDGPRDDGLPQQALQFPPRERGWTQIADLEDAISEVSPA